MQLQHISAQLRVLADPTRLRIVHLLWRFRPNELSAGELVDVLAAPQPNVSRHLKVLHEARVVCRRVDGLFRYYALVEEPSRLQQALLGSLEIFVPYAPTVQEDLRRARDTFSPASAPDSEDDRRSGEYVTKELLFASGGEQEDRVFAALDSQPRRRMLDIIKRVPGSTVQRVAASFDITRIAVMRHLRVLEEAELVLSFRQGRERHLYYNPVPLQLVYDRWTSELGAVFARA